MSRQDLDKLNLAKPKVDSNQFKLKKYVKI